MATFDDGESGLSVRTKINAVLQHADGTSGELVVNDSGADVDFRVESDTKTHAIFVDGASGYVGINNATPGVALDIAGDITATGAGQFGDDVDITGELTVTGDLTVDTNTLYVDATNNRVGINNATPSQPLDVVGAIKTNGGLLFGATSSYMYESAADTIAWRIGSDGPFFTMGDAGSNTVNLFNVSGAIAFGAANSEKMRLTTTGRLGIGTSTPGAPLDVIGVGWHRGVSTEAVNLSVGIGRSGDGASYVDLVGDATYTTYGARFVRFGGANSNTVLYHRGTGNFGLNAQEAAAIFFSTTGTERMRITSAGDVGIGEGVPDYKLDVNGSFGFTPGASVTPVDNGDVVFELTNNTTLTIKAKGSDGVVRSGTITLS